MVSNFCIVVVSGVTIVSFLVLSTSDIPKVLLKVLVIDSCKTVKKLSLKYQIRSIKQESTASDSAFYFK